MKFDPFAWNEVKPNEKISPRKILRLRADAPGALWCEAEGVETLVALGAAFEVETPEAVTFIFRAGAGIRVFVHEPVPTTAEASGEVFTNIDRMPDESGTLAEVTRARRMFELERRAMLREIRAERDAAVAEVAAAQPGPKLAAKSETVPADPAESDPAPADDGGAA